jgi:N-acetylmuramoyl-L-alanine amidase
MKNELLFYPYNLSRNEVFQVSKVRIVLQGECIGSIALQAGFFPETLWEHADNEPLRLKRANGQCLLPGDEVKIPDKRVKNEDCTTSQRHTFKRKGVPDFLRVQFLIEDEPRSFEKYQIDIDGNLRKGTTDGEGRLVEVIAPNAKLGRFRFNGSDETTEFYLGGLDPIDSVTGVKGRLRNLGYPIERMDQIEDEEFEDAIEWFQGFHDLELTGSLNDETNAKLAEECNECAGPAGQLSEST